MSRKNIIKIVFIMVMGVLAAPAAAAPINYALGGTVTASSSWAGNGPANVIDGNSSTVWNSGGFLLAWIQIDLGVSQMINEVDAFVVQSPAGNTVHNLYLDNVLMHTWNQVTSNGDLLTWVLPAATNVQLIKLETVTSPSWVAWGEISVLGNAAQVPAPTAFVLLALGLVAVVSMKKYQSA